MTAALLVDTREVVQLALEDHATVSKSDPLVTMEADMRRNGEPAAFALSVIGPRVPQTRRQFMHAGARISVGAVVLSASFGVRRRWAHAESAVTRVGYVAPGQRPTTGRPNMLLKAFQEELRTLGLPEARRSSSRVDSQKVTSSGFRALSQISCDST